MMWSTAPVVFVVVLLAVVSLATPAKKKSSASDDDDDLESDIFAGFGNTPAFFDPRNPVSCEVTELRECNCTKDGAVLCLNTEFDDVEILNKLPEGTNMVVFRGNHFSTLRSANGAIFQRKDLAESIRVLDLDNNEIQVINGQAFNHLKKLTTLVLSNNDLRITDAQKHPKLFTGVRNLEKLQMSNTFNEFINSTDTMLSLADVFYASNLTKLKMINLESNEIKSFANIIQDGHRRDLWCAMPNIERIKLSHNSLATFKGEAECLQKLSFLDLSRNALTTPQSDMLTLLDSLPSLHTVDLSLNRFACDCQLYPFVQWLKRTKLVSEEAKRDLTCSTSYDNLNNGVRVLEVSEDELLCRSSSTDSSLNSSNVAVGLAVTLLCVVIIIVGYINRHAVATYLWGCTRQVKQVNTTRKYTHIVHDADQGEYQV